MTELGEGDELSLSHLPFGLLNQSAILGSERVMGMDDALRLDQDAIVLLSERHEIPLPGC